MGGEVNPEDGDGLDYTFGGQATFMIARDEDDYCSSIRIDNGKTIIFLISTNNGKFNTNGVDLSYAVSKGTKGFDNIQ